MLKMNTEAVLLFDEIVDKTKEMLGENYRGDKELLPVFSASVPIEGHTDAVLTVSNDKFDDKDMKLIKEKTKNYAWWVANKGYIMDDTNKEIPALFIYGSETGSLEPDVLNFNGKTTNSFYNMINRTNMQGEINNSLNHIYILYTIAGQSHEFETDLNGVGDGTIMIEDIKYNMYAGRLYPEDRIIVDKNLMYPIYLISNLDYYNISDMGAVKNPLNGAHDISHIEKNNLEVLRTVCEMVIREAGQWTNRNISVQLLNDCWAVIIKCSCAAYLNRGVEGLNSQSELGQQNAYVDWVTVLHKQITNRRYVM